MTIREQINAVLAHFGLGAKVKAGLSQEETEKVANEYKARYNAELADDLAKMQADESKAEAFNAIKEALKGVAAEEEDEKKDEDPEDEKSESEEGDKKEDEEDEQPSAEAADIVKKVNKLLSDNEALKKENEKMAKLAIEDKPEAVVRHTKALGGSTTASHLYGIEHDMFSLNKRWNKLAAKGQSVLFESYNADKTMRELKAEVSSYGQDLCTRMSELQGMGMLNVVALTTEGSIDYSGLSDANLGDQYVVRRMDALIAQILMLPNLTDIFPMRSNIQDKELLTNAFFGEFSQSYQPGELSKGSMELQPEVATVYDVMFKYLFHSFKWIERTYLGYLNTSGSNPIKWNLIEWMILQIATALKNVPFAQYKEMMRNSDVLLDQIYGYTPAMNALLGMSQGLILVGGGEPESYELIDEKELRPIINVQPNEEDIYRQLEWLALHPEHIERLKRESIEYTHRHHDSIKVAKQYLEAWSK